MAMKSCNSAPRDDNVVAKACNTGNWEDGSHVNICFSVQGISKWALTKPTSSFRVSHSSLASVCR